MVYSSDGIWFVVLFVQYACLTGPVSIADFTSPSDSPSDFFSLRSSHGGGASALLACGASATPCTAAVEVSTPCEKVGGSSATSSRCFLKAASVSSSSAISSSAATSATIFSSAAISATISSLLSSSWRWLGPTSCEEGASSEEDLPSLVTCGVELGRAMVSRLGVPGPDAGWGRVAPQSAPKTVCGCRRHQRTEPRPAVTRRYG